MGLIAATLNGHRVMSGRVHIPKWGFWHAEVTLDGEITLAGAAVLKIADATFNGTVTSGGPSKGRSTFRIVAGAGGWGRTIKRKSYANDANDKISTVLGDAAREIGETLAPIASTERVGANFTRPEATASTVLQMVAAQAWYVDEAGVTRLGSRAPGALVGTVTRVTPVNLARGKIVLAAESIATILPGLVVDGLTAVDVEHDISANGLRSTVWGSQEGSALDSFRGLMEQADPSWRFRGVTEYRVGELEGTRLNLQPVLVSTGMPDLHRVTIRPGVPGCSAETGLGSYVLVGFVNADESRPFVAHFPDEDSAGFQPTKLVLRAGGQAGGEHVMTTEATCLLIYNTLVALMAAAGGGPLLAAVLQPLLGAAIATALGAQAAPAPPTAAAQIIAAAALQAGFAAGTTPSNAMFAAWTTAIAALSTKTANDSGDFPSVGSAAVEAG